ncbi:hypothetical protein J2Y60_001163 [Arcicella sp. BE140]|nr:hypothetical protein [Arcicella sp. BE51]MDR6810978.1 hypothetical protein [Arcicella sp. BE140]MDR6822328.1 hypothetical protein [Arcicella sp. BE139]
MEKALCYILKIHFLLAGDLNPTDYPKVYK